jgi:hypothetical protein
MKSFDCNWPNVKMTKFAVIFGFLINQNDYNKILALKTRLHLTIIIALKSHGCLGAITVATNFKDTLIFISE